MKTSRCTHAYIAQAMLVRRWTTVQVVFPTFNHLCIDIGCSLYRTRWGVPKYIYYGTPPFSKRLWSHRQHLRFFFGYIRAVDWSMSANLVFMWNYLIYFYYIQYYILSSQVNISSCKLNILICELNILSYQLNILTFKVNISTFKVNILSCKLKISSCKLNIWSYELKILTFKVNWV